MLARLAELPLLVVLLGITGGFALVPALHALASDDNDLARGFFYSALILMMATVMLGIATAAYSPRDAARSHLAALAGAYLVLPVAMALPMLETVPDTSFANAWFEMISCFTTTGASVYAPERLPDSVHLWRATVGWFGGFFILLAAYAILAPLNLGGAEVASGRVPGRSALGATQVTRIADPAERLTRFALQLFPVYTALTLLLWLGLLVAGERGITALIHAMGTLSTSGISGKASLATANAGFLGEALIFCFLIFAVTRQAWPGARPARNRQGLIKDPELRLAILIVLCVTTVLFLRHWFLVEQHEMLIEGPIAPSALWGILFTTWSFLTTTGYVSGSWDIAAEWSGFGISGMILLALAMIGGGSATTAGGVKLLRVYALLRHGERELERIIHPNSVGSGGGDARRLRREGAQIAWVFFMLFAISVGFVISMLSLLGVAFEPALALTIAALTTTGALAELGPAEPVVYAGLTDPVKVVLGAAMVVGRLETLALIALVLPGRNRR